MTKAKTETQHTGDRSARQDTINGPLPYDPVVEAIRILARRGQQLREAEERAAQAAASRADDESPADTHKNQN